MGLHIIKHNVNINFIGARKIAFVISALIILLGLGSLLVKGGPTYGIDFAGGMMIQVKFDGPVEIDRVKGKVSQTKLDGLVVQRIGDDADNEFLLRLPLSDVAPEQVRADLVGALGDEVGGVKYTMQRVEMVGPKVGADLRTKALEALFYAVLLIAIYISGRFEQRWWTAGFMAAALSTAMYFLGMFMPIGMLTIAAMAVALGLCWRLQLNYALGAVVALIHDVIITVGIFSLLNKEFDLTIVAALLTIIGYSLNDTIIVFDRIRENLRGKVEKTFSGIINKSINQTLSRTLLTSGTTLLVVLCLYFLGGGVIHDFALALLIGVLVGTYSSIFVASPILLVFEPRPEEDE